MDEKNYVKVETICWAGSKEHGFKITVENAAIVPEGTKRELVNEEMRLQNKVLIDKELAERKPETTRVKGLADNEFHGNCPLCGHTLRKRTSNRGDFLGCSNYPKCRHTQPL
jgi:hypothetical protein